VVIVEGEGQFGGEFAAMGTLLHRCVEVRTAIELLFGMVSGVGPGIHVLEGNPCASRGRGSFGHGFWHFLAFVPVFV